METGTTILVLLGVLGFFAIVIAIIIFAFKRIFKNTGASLVEIENRLLPSLENDSMAISPTTRQSLVAFGEQMQDISHLQAMQAKELHQFLKLASSVIKVLENRLFLINEACDACDAFIAFWKDAPHERKMANKKSAPVQQRLENELIRTNETLQQHLDDMPVLEVIPNLFRSSAILDMMCTYLSTGEESDWRGCVKAFRDDSKHAEKMREEKERTELFRSFDRRLANIESYTKATERNTAYTAFFMAMR